jgi:hypothetical protein
VLGQAKLELCLLGLKLNLFFRILVIKIFLFVNLDHFGLCK